MRDSESGRQGGHYTKVSAIVTVQERGSAWGSVWLMREKEGELGQHTCRPVRHSGGDRLGGLPVATYPARWTGGDSGEHTPTSDVPGLKHGHACQVRVL